jgi:hypothetical protein
MKDQVITVTVYFVPVGFTTATLAEPVPIRWWLRTGFAGFEGAAEPALEHRDPFR